MIERRRYVRLNISLEVSYMIQGEDDAAHKSITKNVSANGARFVIQKDLPKGTVLDLEVKLPIQSDPIPIRAKVVWSKQEAEQEKSSYDAGFEFIQIPERDKNIFFQYLCNLMYNQFKKIQ